MSSLLDEELTSCSAIFSPDELSLSNTQTAFPTLALRVQPREGEEDNAVVFRLRVCRATFPAPIALALEIDGLSRGLRAVVMADVAAMTELRLFELLCLLRDHVTVEAEGAGAASGMLPPLDAPPQGYAPPPPLSSAVSSVTPVIYSGPVNTVMKSAFVAHVAQLTCPEDVAAVLDALYRVPSVAKATHNMFAWRLRDGATRGLRADNDDDGEAGAGSKLASLLELMKAENCLVVVSRWYGGVQMGPRRFAVISETAQRAIDAQPWYAGRKAAS